MSQWRFDCEPGLPMRRRNSILLDSCAGHEASAVHRKMQAWNRSRAYFLLPLRNTSTDWLARSAAVSSASIPSTRRLLTYAPPLADRAACFAFASS